MHKLYLTVGNHKNNTSAGFFITLFSFGKWPCNNIHTKTMHLASHCGFFKENPV